MCVSFWGGNVCVSFEGGGLCVCPLGGGPHVPRCQANLRLARQSDKLTQTHLANRTLTHIVSSDSRTQRRVTHATHLFERVCIDLACPQAL